MPVSYSPVVRTKEDIAFAILLGSPMVAKIMVSADHTKPQIVPKIPNTFEVLGEHTQV